MRYMNEKQVLRKLGIPDFRHLTKATAVKMVSMLDRMDPEVAKAAIAQFPELAQMTLSVAEQFRDTVLEGLKDNKEVTLSAIASINVVIEAVRDELKRDDITPEERTALTNDLIELAKLMHEIDRETKRFHLKVFGIAGGVLASVVVAVAAVLGGNASVEGGEFDDDDDEEDCF